MQQLTFSRGEVPTARFAHDGRQVLYTGASAGERARIYSTSVDRPDYRSLSLDEAKLLAISSRGDVAVALRPTWHLFEDGGRGTLAVVPLVGGSPRELLEAVSYADWSPDGANLAVIHRVGSTSPPGVPHREGPPRVQRLAEPSARLSSRRPGGVHR